MKLTNRNRMLSGRKGIALDMLNDSFSSPKAITFECERCRLKTVSKYTGYITDCKFQIQNHQS